MNKKRYAGILILLLLFVFSAVNVQAAAPKLNKSRTELLCGKHMKLKADQTVLWSSSDDSVATVNQKGKVTAVGCGEAVIHALNKKGQKTSCVVSVTNYTVKKTSGKRAPRRVTVYTDGEYKTYKVYNKLGFRSSAIQSRGCAHSAVATVMSAYGMKWTPQDIHFGSAKVKYSERYAWKKTEGYSSIGKRPLTVYAMSEILKNAGIKNKAVYKYQDENAVRMITDNLEAGRPVIIRVNGRFAYGTQFTDGPNHYVTLAGLDEKGYPIVMDSIGGLVNATKYTGKYRLTVGQLVKKFMGPCKGDPYASFYRTDGANNGGFILITQ